LRPASSFEACATCIVGELYGLTGCGVNLSSRLSPSGRSGGHLLEDHRTAARLRRVPSDRPAVPGAGAGSRAGLDPPSVAPPRARRALC